MPLTKKDLELVYRQHGSLVYRRAFAILKNEAEAQEILQELFVSLLEKPDGFRGESSMTTFLYAATTHRALRKIRDRSNRLRLLKDVVAVAPALNLPPRSDHWADVQSILKHIPETYAVVGVLRYLDGMSRDEIGLCVGCSGRQVGNRLQEFNRLARELLDPSAVSFDVNQAGHSEASVTSTALGAPARSAVPTPTDY